MVWRRLHLKKIFYVRWRRWLRPHLDPLFRNDFPLIDKKNHRVSSPATDDYNCWSYALGMDDRWCSPKSENDSVWPQGIARSNTVETWISVFGLFGYTRCDSPDHEKGVEKVAIYTDSRGRPIHAARQISSGQWTSKVGTCEDIIHKDLIALEGGRYGQAHHFLSRHPGKDNNQSEVQWERNRPISKITPSRSQRIWEQIDKFMEAVFREKKR